jgi:hypothetical protein
MHHETNNAMETDMKEYVFFKLKQMELIRTRHYKES